MTANSMAAGLRALADMVEQHPALADAMSYPLDSISAPLGSQDNPREAMAQFIRAGLASGAEISKDYGGTWSTVSLAFGEHVRLEVFASREQICERVVTGTTEVTRQVPDPDALAAVPKVTVTETVEQIEWICTPLLAETPAAVTA